MEGEKKHQHLKLKIAVSGAADTAHCGENVYQLGSDLGREVAEQGAILIDGATTGFPFLAAKAAKEAGGVVIGISPAATEREHVELYKLPLDFHDLIIYTGFGYSGRNVFMTRAADAVVVGCGRIGTVNEFTVAFEDGKPLGVLEADWPTDGVFKLMVEKSNRTNEKLVFDPSPKTLITKMIELIEKDKGENYGVYATPEKFYKECEGVDCKVIL